MRSDAIREMDLQSCGNPSQHADEKHGFRTSESIWRTDSRIAPGLSANLTLLDYGSVARGSGTIARDNAKAFFG